MLVARPPAVQQRRVQEPLRQVPVVERHERLDAGPQQRVDQLAVEGDALLADAVLDEACGDDARPGDAEAVVLQPHGLHERDVGFPHVVVVVRHVARRTLGLHLVIRRARGLLAAVVALRTRHAQGVGARERVPDRGAAAALAVAAFDLVGGRAQAPREAVGEAAVQPAVAQVVVLRVVVVQVGQRPRRALAEAAAGRRLPVARRRLHVGDGLGRGHRRRQAELRR
mmetsp:Transcript_43972/g.113620  ORF Transcript_43972/g.113620 Transcript_43972/m.113620 type:complete len:226 (-) Transcript_43972:55-732(-)